MRKAATAISLALALLLAFPLASELVVSHYRRGQAAKLLAIVHGLHPGTTTEAQARAALKPFSRNEQESDRQGGEIVVRQVNYQFFNSTEWIDFLAYHLKFLPLRLTLPWTMFEVDLDFVDGLLARVDIIEMQEDRPGFPHPNSASVSIYSNRLRTLQRNPYGPTPDDFNGYSEYSRSTGSVDQNGKWTGFNCCHARFIKLDERANPNQLAQSFNFQLHCLTSFIRCKDDRQILP
jgi:hypothetical protein